MSVQSNRAPEPVGAYPHAKRVGNLLFLSGIGPRKRGSKEIPGVTIDSTGRVTGRDIATQCMSVFENVRLVLEDAGARWEDIVDVTVFLTHMREDFDTFERLLSEVHAAYGREDLSALRSRMTPEMLSYYAEELSENASRGVINEISDVKLLQGDLAEAWREGDKEYASVAMRYSLKDRYVDRATGKAADGTDAPQEATEVWTFMRSHGGSWLLSAIQQTQ